MEELIYSLRKGIIGRAQSPMGSDMNEPRTATGETVLARQKEPGWGWDHVARGAKVRK